MSAPTPPAVPFGTRLAAAMDAHGPLCVGIDPHPHLLEQWDLPDTAEGVRRFSLHAVEALAGQVAAVKPQAAFFERHGSAGIAALAEVIRSAREAGVLCILDAKRGDIGSTMAAYADAYAADSSDLAADALTVSPFLGYEALRPLLQAATAGARGVFVLALTSNPEGAEVQHARDPQGRSVAAAIAAQAAADNAPALSAGAPLGSIGLVVGATVGRAPRATGTDLAAVGGPLLAPGVGAQGAGVSDLAATFGPALPAVLATASRSILTAGPSPSDLTRAARDLAAALARATGR